MYQPADHVITWNLNIISDSRIRWLISKRPKYRFSSHIRFTEIMSRRNCLLLPSLFAFSLFFLLSILIFCYSVLSLSFFSFFTSCTPLVIIFKVEGIPVYWQKQKLLLGYSVGRVRHSTMWERQRVFGVYISQLIRFARASSSISDFNCRNKALAAKLLRQGCRYHKLRKAFSKFYSRHSGLIEIYNVSLKKLLQQGISEPEFYGD